MWFNFTFRHWGVNKSVSDSFRDRPVAFRYVPDTQPGIDDGHIMSNAGVAWQISSKDKLTTYHDNQRKYRNHWGISALVPADASAIQVTPTSFVNVTKWTRTQTNRLLFEGGFAIYDQEYTELYQPEVTGHPTTWDLDAISNAKVYTSSTTRTASAADAWNNPADHFSLMRTFSGPRPTSPARTRSASAARSRQGDWRLVRQGTGDVQPVEFNNGAPTAATLRLPTDRRNGIKADTGLFAQDRWTMKRVTLNLGLRYDWFIGETQESDVLAEPVQRRTALRQVFRRQERSGGRLRRHGAGLEGHLAARRRSPTTCSATAGRRSRRASPATSPASRSTSPTTSTRCRPWPHRQAAVDATSTATACPSTPAATSSSTS